MAYSLMLTESERKAFDWIGGRYSSTGYDTAILIQEGLPVDKAWDDSGDITFNISESVAWEIQELADSEEYQWPCFADNLAHKMQKFCDAIV